MIKYALTCSILLFLSCNSGPKVIPVDTKYHAPELPETEKKDPHEGLDMDITVPGITEVFTQESHEVTVLESMPTDRYLYLKVKENNDEFWIATDKKDVKIGKTYFFNSGVYQTNFKSKEYDKVFDEIILVSNLTDPNEKHSELRQKSAEQRAKAPELTEAIAAAPGITRIGDIVNNPQDFENKKVTIKAKCVKVNEDIMNRNWIHIMDGSQDDYDLIITSTDRVEINEIVTMSGVVSLNRDFGAGYKYDIIIEEGSKLAQL